MPLSRINRKESPFANCYAEMIGMDAADAESQCSGITAYADERGAYDPESGMLWANVVDLCHLGCDGLAERIAAEECGDPDFSCGESKSGKPTPCHDEILWDGEIGELFDLCPDFYDELKAMGYDDSVRIGLDFDTLWKRCQDLAIDINEELGLCCLGDCEDEPERNLDRYEGETSMRGLNLLAEKIAGLQRLNAKMQENWSEAKNCSCGMGQKRRGSVCETYPLDLSEDWLERDCPGMYEKLLAAGRCEEQGGCYVNVTELCEFGCDGIASDVHRIICGTPYSCQEGAPGQLADDVY